MLSKQWNFTILWSLASLVGAGLGAALGWFGVSLYLSYSADRGAVDLLTILILMPLIGLGYGAGQTLLLFHKIRGAGVWAIITAVGWLLGLSVQFYLSNLGMGAAWVGFALAGLYLGGLQWLLLYFIGLHRRMLITTLWIPLSLAAWLLAYGLMTLVNGPLQTLTQQAMGGALASVLTWALVGGVTGLLTGPLLTYFLKRDA